MKTNAAGKQIIKTYEGCRLTAYKCPAGKWTIGYGETLGVKEGMTITQAEADAMFDSALSRYEEPISAAVEMNENQFSACVSLAYNIGVHAFLTSTLLRMYRLGDIAGAADQFGAWTKGGGRILPGLIRRREAEKALFLTPVEAAE